MSFSVVISSGLLHECFDEIALMYASLRPENTNFYFSLDKSVDFAVQHSNGATVAKLASSYLL
jgi:hypothetical protein